MAVQRILLYLFWGKKIKRRELTLVTQRALSSAPLEALNDAVFDGAEQRLVHLHGKRRRHQEQYKTSSDFKRMELCVVVSPINRCKESPDSHFLIV